MNQYEQWEKATKDSSDYVLGVMESTPTDPEEKDFVVLSKFIFETEENPWGFLPSGWQESKSSAQAFEGFLCCLHHAMLDDGEVCFIEDPTHGPCMEFNHSTEAEPIYLGRYHKDYETRDKRFNEIIKSEKPYSSIKGIVYHDDVQRFIDGFEKHRTRSVS
jgi:hypothetical protein